MIYDAVVVGAGPAGAHFARTLANAGGKVALVDRSEFPRDKLCGGFLTDKTIELLAAAYPGLPFSGTEIRRVHAFYKGEPAASFHILSKAKTIRRYELDTSLVHEAEGRGAHLYLADAAYLIDLEKNEVVLKDGRVLRYAHLIGADGACSTVRRLVGLSPNQTGFCAEAHIPWSDIKEPGKLREGGVGIYYGDLPSGYGWVFPCRDSVVVGVGNLTDGLPEEELVALFYPFRDQIARSSVKPRGAYLPSGQSIALGVPGRENLYLVGDAAGLIDPFTGEGIYYALRSAEIAAEVILSGTPACSEYRRRMEKVIGAIGENCRIRDELYTPSVLSGAISSMRAAPQYSEGLIDQAILRYSKSYRDAYEEFQSYAR